MKITVNQSQGNDIMKSFISGERPIITSQTNENTIQINLN